MPGATASPWGLLLGEPVPDVRTASAHLVVAGRRVATPKEVLAALSMNAMRQGIAANDDDDAVTEGDVQLARKYCARLERIGVAVDPIDMAKALPIVPRKKAGRPRKECSDSPERAGKRAAFLSYYDRHRDEILARQRLRQQEKARQRDAARDAAGQVPKLTIAERLAAVDADQTLTKIQRKAKKYYLTHYAKESTPCA
jgi:hypothetical protein